jgi:hypothetical protein
MEFANLHLNRLQSVHNAAARLIFGLRRTEPITEALFQLHWLRVPERICFKLAVLTYGALHAVRRHISPSSLQFPASRVVAVFVQRLLTAALFLALDCRLLVIERSQLLVLPFGTVFTFTRHLPFLPQITFIHSILSHSAAV